MPVSSVAELEAAARELRSGVTVVLAPGRYVLAQPLRIGGLLQDPPLAGISLRRASGARDDVTIVGRGVVIGHAHGVQIANVTLADVDGPASHLRGEDGARAFHVYNVQFANATGPMVWSTTDRDRADGGVNDVLIEHSAFEHTATDPAHQYSNGISVYRGRQWVIRHNSFRGFHSRPDAPSRLRPAVAMRDGSEGTFTHDNLFVDCAQAIAYGVAGPDGAVDHVGGAIYNNFVYRRRGFRGGDAGILLWGSPGTKVHHSTVVQNGTYKRAIEYRFASTTASISATT